MSLMILCSYWPIACASIMFDRRSNLCFIYRV